MNSTPTVLLFGFGNGDCLRQTIFEQRAVGKLCDCVVVSQSINFGGSLLEKDFELFFVTTLVFQQPRVV